MWKNFLGGASTCFLLMALGIRLECQFPPREGPPGHELVAIHGLQIYRTEIRLEDMPNRSSIPALAALGVALVIGTLAGGGVTLLISWVVARYIPSTADQAKELQT
jgi:hypothetical protein